jgi:Cytochrome P450
MLFWPLTNTRWLLYSESLFYTVSTWRVNRKLIMPTFNPRILEGFVDVFIAQTHIIVQKLTKEFERSIFDVFHYFNLCSLDTICGEKLYVRQMQ